MAHYGVDLSKHNGNVDFAKLKADGNDFVIIRAGYSDAKDPKFEELYKQAIAHGFHVGAYWYTYALTVGEAEKEAEKFLEAIKGKKFDYPLYVDMEDADGWKKKHGMPSNETLTNICVKFCQMLEKNGYYAGVYASESWFKNQLAGLNKNRYDIWVANWGDNDAILSNSERKTQYRLHQYTSSYVLGGKRFDRNIVYDYDYPTVIKNKGLNGYTKSSTSTSKPTSTNRLDTMSDEQVANEIVKGEGNWGSGDTRKKKLGSRYASIQALVNKKLGATSTPTKTLKVDASVKIKSGAKDLNTKKAFSSFVYNTTYKVIKIDGNNVVFGKNGVATGKVNKSDIILV